MDRDRLSVSNRWQCVLLGGGPVMVPFVVVTAPLSGDGALTVALVLPATVLGGLLASHLWDGGLPDSVVVGAGAGSVAVLPVILYPLWVFVGILRDSGGVGVVVAFFFLTALASVVGLLAAVTLGAVGGPVVGVPRPP